MSFKVEVAQLKHKVNNKQIEEFAISLIEKKKIAESKIIKIPSPEYPEGDRFRDEVHSITFHQVASTESSPEFFFYEFSNQGPELESIESHDNEQVSASTHWMLPNKDEFFGLWESLIYEDGLKDNLLDFAQTMLLFSMKNIDQNIVSCNRLMLLHGEPGTGKTSLAKALAQKLSIHMQGTYQFTHLFEINSHSLFSKWFSESGKLVMKMFEQIQEVIDNSSSLVCVLIDEVESIAYARGSVSTNEPSDAVRVVNSVLTQLDRIKKYPNVLVIATSNLTASIDLAFLDRADVVCYIGQPSIEAVVRILLSAITELGHKGIIEDNLKVQQFTADVLSGCQGLEQENQNRLAEICSECVGLSGRALRKLPFLAHALFLKKESASLQEYLAALKRAVEYQKSSKMSIGQHNEITTNGYH